MTRDGDGPSPSRVFARPAQQAEAISTEGHAQAKRDCFASLAMTRGVGYSIFSEKFSSSNTVTAGGLPLNPSSAQRATTLS